MLTTFFFRHLCFFFTQLKSLGKRDAQHYGPIQVRKNTHEIRDLMHN